MGVDFFIHLGTKVFEKKVEKVKKITLKPLHNRFLYFYICTHTWSNVPTHPHYHTLTPTPHFADVAQLVERNLAKVEVAGSNLVIRSLPSSEGFFIDLLRKAFFLKECDRNKVSCYLCRWVLNTPTLSHTHTHTLSCGNSSVGRALASQAGGREFESRFPL